MAEDGKGGKGKEKQGDDMWYVTSAAKEVEVVAVDVVRVLKEIAAEAHVDRDGDAVRICGSQEVPARVSRVGQDPGAGG